MLLSKAKQSTHFPPLCLLAMAPTCTSTNKRVESCCAWYCFNHCILPIVSARTQSDSLALATGP